MYRFAFHRISEQQERLNHLIMLYQKTICLLLSFVLCSSMVFAQERLGLQTDNYAGINGANLNPASTALTPLKWDVNLIGAGAYVNNNYAYLSNTSLLHLLRNTDKVELSNNINQEKVNAPDAITLDFFDNRQQKFAHIDATVMGPGIRVAIKDKAAIGLFTRARAVVGADDIPSSLGYYQYLEQAYNDEFGVSPFKANGMVWAEVGANYATRLSKKTNYGWSIGGNVRYLQGYESFFVDNNIAIDVSKLSTDSLAFAKGEVNYGYASQIPALIGNEGSYQLQKLGSGVAADIGIMYASPNKNDDGYNWKVGASLLDIGRIGFNKSAQQHSLSPTENFDFSTNPFEEVNTSEELFQQVSEQVLGDELASLQGEKLNMNMPLALNLQAEFAAGKNFFVNAMTTQQLSNGKTGLERPNVVAITPRIESKWLALSAPLSWNQGDFQLGTALRLGTLTVGSDNIMSVFKKQTAFNGSDVYVSLKIQEFGSKSQRNKNKRGQLDCPKVERLF